MASQGYRHLLLLPGRWKKLNCCLLVVLPVAMTLGLAVFMVCRAKNNLQQSRHGQEGLADRMYQLSTLIMDLNNERELTILYAAAKSSSQTKTLLPRLLRSRLLTDESLASMTSWPATSGDPYILQSWHLFKAVLRTQRSRIQRSSYFWDEIPFYTDVIETLHLWLSREPSLALAGPELWRWAVSLAQLMSCLNFLGVQESLCGVYRSIVCFSHRETFIFANYSFSGEAAFEIYNQNYPASNDHLSFAAFSGLSNCRQSVFAGLEYGSTADNDIPCEVASTNITTSHEVERFVRLESIVIDEQMRSLVKSTLNAHDDHLSHCALVLTAVIVYIITVLFIRTVIIMYLNKQAKHVRFKLRRDSMELMEEQPSPTPKSDSRQQLCNPTSRHDAMRVLKVATV
ncbi:hypothetical protein CAPTEDRAFT_216161 [Capitella teleta]|uniref:Nitrate/nitrite sensing protein domain-containing protein n=1 Tax=Capitella teleta TaxID=283909 RepID=R7UGA6_CAPTE|nr:hypothetical protein CAPTEDRAFT_216161 [Capitella teleta]|eukprot:ELU05108.1 hypothetical protein CAPTEDRAFT_216161 [Capitella teleta]